MTLRAVELLKDARDRLVGFIGSDCECDNTHEQNGTKCCLCEYLDAITPGKFDHIYIKAAQNHRHIWDGELEVDDEAIVSKGTDHGAYVQAWLWVDDKDCDPELLTCGKCKTLMEHNGDCYDDLCPECADKEYGGDDVPV